MAQDYKTMRVPEDAYDEAKAAKRDGETWGEYLRRCGETPPEVRRFVEVGDEQEPVTLEATERRAIAEEVAKVLR